MFAIAIHGGAGAIPKHHLPKEREAQYLAGLEAALNAGYEILKSGGASLDAVTVAVRVLEDDPSFNAGRGAALTRDGWAELDASIMEGKHQHAGAVASLRRIKNPIELARRVMEKSRHVLLVGDGAEEFALEEGFAFVPNSYFRTPERKRQLDSELAGEQVSEIMPGRGTVGAVALDEHGNLAAATSTGGMTMKRHGRVGDSPIIGAGTYAKNGACAVSCTGHGESFIRAVAAYHVCASMEYRGLTLKQAVHETLHERVSAMGGDGGMIAIDAQGNVVMDFSSEAMFRGMRTSRGESEVTF
jgi:beta-aspartyl-peptidase (threonine type)